MACCEHCQDAGSLFSDRTAGRELKRYRRRGPVPTTRLLIEAVRPHLPPEATLLDVGGGIGAIHHELLEAGAARAVHVDASAAYLAASREESERRGHDGRVEHLYGDYAELADELADADAVTLDRVVCCYPDMERLVDTSAARARRVYGLVYPRDRWAMRAFQAVANLYMRLRRSAFRTYLHSPAAIDARVARHGLSVSSRSRTFLWEVVAYTSDRGAGATPDGGTSTRERVREVARRGARPRS